MIFSILILFLASFLPGAIALRFHLPQTRASLILIFAGSYLFSITILHILPELFDQGNVQNIGLFVLLGFFFQRILELFTSGVEHGHMHIHRHGENHISSQWLIVIIALSIHSLLEGSLLAHPSTLHENHSSYSILMGIVLHHIPASIALVSILKCELKLKWQVLFLLFVFASSGPIGWLLGENINQWKQMESYLPLLFAFVSGNFLHISTTIFVETNPEHKIGKWRLIISLLGALVAYLAEMAL